MIEPPLRHHTAAAREFISTRLGLRDDPGMQDWEFEVAEVSGLPEYLALFEKVTGQKDVRFTLADMIIQAFEDTGTDLASDPQWAAFLGSLADDIEIHGSQIWSWASWDVPLNEAWNVAPFMRTLCKVHFAG
ncbi:hypothetical protein N6L27_06400 [Leisingera sp. SS27]|uniref:hypothetical protein n=1 Tax=Leisingera sp. SS27 TaxID=2979462 RepID=UPI00232B3B8F|nr:hypothetical protein [Leisingera sp. SS27]MDC0657618.1 hypothetical protein [Leisingera sp. SS27]